MQIVPSQTDLFSACSKVLDKQLAPMNYRRLTIDAVQLLGYDVDDVQMFRTIEDVREKLPLNKSHGIFYTGAPSYMMAKRRWFKTMQLPLMNVEPPIEIPGSATSGAVGAYVALMRSPYMVDKWNGNTERRNYMRSHGLVLEQHVKDWFRVLYPDFYREPDNSNNWQMPSSEDFQLVIDDSVLRVDVAGKNRNGNHGAKKRPTDLHLLCEIVDKHVYWSGVTRGSEWGEYVIPESAMSPQSMLVWLNCAKNDIDYAMMRNCAMM